MIWLYYLLLILMPFWNYPRLPKFGETLTVIKLVGIAAVLAAALHSFLTGTQARLLKWSESKLFLLLLIWICISSYTISRWEWAENPFTSSISIAAYLYPTLIFVSSLEAVRKACFCIVFSMLLASYSVFSQFVKYNVGRPGGVVGDPNYYALVSVTVLPLCVLLWSGAKGVARVGLGLATILIIASTMLGASRGGFVSLVFCFVYLGWRSRRRLIMLAAFFAAVLVLDSLLPHSPLDRFSQPDNATKISTEARKQLLEAGWAMIRTHPVTGVGLGMYKPLVPQYHPALQSGGVGHNTYVEVAAELGLPALGIFVGILCTAWLRARQTASWFEESGNQFAAQVARALEAGIASYAVAALFLSAQFAKQLWTMIWFGLALARIAAREQHEQFTVLAECAAFDPRYLSR
jgi:O-antigen ligase